MYMSKQNLLKVFKPLTPELLWQKVTETSDWIEQFSHTEGDTKFWDVLPGQDVPAGSLLLKDTCIYGGAAGIALFYLRLYRASGEEKYLENAKQGINYCIRKYQGADEFRSDAAYLKGADIGFLNGPCGGAYAAARLYEITKDVKYKEFAIRLADDLLAAATEENGYLFWYGDYGIIGEGGLYLYLIDVYETFGNKRYLDAAYKGARYILSWKENAPAGGYRWYVMDTETFPTIQKPGGYFPGFEYGAAGTGYILAVLYRHTGDPELLRAAEGAAAFIRSLAVYSEDGEAALIPYNDTFLEDLFYLGVCQGPPGTSRLFYMLYKITGKAMYKDFIVKLTNGILAAGAPAIHSEGYWRTNCYCSGTAGMLEHFIHVSRLTGRAVYLKAAFDAAKVLIGESEYDRSSGYTSWYTAWNRHEPWKSEAYTGLYHGSAGCASSLLALAQYLKKKPYGPSYLEEPYKERL